MKLTSAALAGLVVAPVISLSCSPAGAAGILECVDAQGHREYAQVCPPGTVTENKLMKSGAGASASGAAAPPKSSAEQDAGFRKRLADQQTADTKAAKDAADAKAAEENCSNARSQLEALQGGQRITKTAANGERIFLQDEDRPAEIAKAQKAADSWCNWKPQAAPAAPAAAPPAGK